MEYDDPGQIPVIYLMMLFNIPVIYLYMPYFAIVNRQILGLGGALPIGRCAITSGIIVRLYPDCVAMTKGKYETRVLQNGHIMDAGEIRDGNGKLVVSTTRGLIPARLARKIEGLLGNLLKVQETN